MSPLTETEIQVIAASPHWITFTDDHFREFTKLGLKSNQILALIHESSNVEFKLVYPIRLKKKQAKGSKLYDECL